MMAVRNNAFSEKKDLHVGGLGASARARLATTADPWFDDALAASRPLLRRAREVMEDANHALRENPWTAVSAVAVLGLTVGFLLSRRF